jgi:hypothetical protein
MKENGTKRKWNKKEKKRKFMVKLNFIYILIYAKGAKSRQTEYIKSKYRCI